MENFPQSCKYFLWVENVSKTGILRDANRIEEEKQRTWKNNLLCNVYGRVAIGGNDETGFDFWNRIQQTTARLPLQKKENIF